MKIGNFDLQKDGVYIIAELSTNHNGNLKIALDSIKAAKEIGANAIKLQTYTANSMTLDCKNKDFLINQGTIWDGKYLYDLYKEACTPLKWHRELFDYARKLDIDIFSSPFDKNAVDFLEQFEPVAYKIASYEITDYDLVRYTASKGKPIIISTGIASIDEILDVVNICKKEANENIILLKCTSAYPSPLESANLNTITNLKSTFGVEVGFSDHTIGTTAPIVAATLGAKVIEKHFILDKSIGSLDCEFSLDKHEFFSMIQAVRDAQKLLGKVDYSMDNRKKKAREHSRSLYFCKNIREGQIITKEDIRIIRPGFGLHPKFLKEILGKKAIKSYKIGHRVEFQ